MSGRRGRFVSRVEGWAGREGGGDVRVARRGREGGGGVRVARRGREGGGDVRVARRGREGGGSDVVVGVHVRAGRI